MNNNIQLHLSLLNELKQAGEIIRAGGVVAFPTETYYGLAVDPFNPKALDRLFRLKQRDRDKPILTLIYDIQQLSRLTDEIPPVYKSLMDNFWPGPLTLVFNGLSSLPSLLTGNNGTVGARISSNPVAQRLVELAGRPLTATSANISGEKSTTNAGQVREQFEHSLLDMIVDGGETPGGKGSTLVGCQNHELFVIRDGAISYELIVKAKGVFKKRTG